MDRTRRPKRPGRSAFAAPAMIFAIAALLAGLWAGLLRLGLAVPEGHLTLAELHGVLMPLGFLGTLIAVERAVAIDRVWAWLPPAASGVGSLWLIAGLPVTTGQVLVGLAGFLLLAVFVALHRIQPSWHNAVMALGALCWGVAGVLWLAGRDISVMVPWLAGFLVLTIGGERLELSRLAALTAQGRLAFLTVIAVLFGGLTVSLFVQPSGVRIAGLGFASLAVWLATHDIARRTIRMHGVTRYMAVALGTGYLWLAAAGVLWLVNGQLTDGPGYDAMLHAIFLGFVMSMVFAHAPVIVPSVLRVRMPFHAIGYAPLVLLHASLLLRLVAGDAAGNTLAWQVGGVLNEIAILLFLGLVVAAVSRARRGAAGRPPATVTGR